MLVNLAYGVDGRTVEVPDDATVILPTDLPGLADQQAAIRHALAHPLAGPSLADLVAPGRSHGAPRVAVVFPDLTRPMPNRTVLPPLLALLERCGIPDDAIALLCATGTHRQATPAEMDELVGPDIVARYTIVDHNSRQRRARRGRGGGRDPGPVAARVRRGRRAHHHRFRGAPFLRRLQRRPQSRMPRSGGDRNDPRSTPPPSHRRCRGPPS